MTFENQGISDDLKKEVPLIYHHYGISLRFPAKTPDDFNLKEVVLRLAAQTNICGWSIP